MREGRGTEIDSGQPETNGDGRRETGDDQDNDGDHFGVIVHLSKIFFQLLPFYALILWRISL